MIVHLLTNMTARQDPITNRPFSEWPPEETKQETFYLRANKEMTEQPSTDEATLSNQAHAAAQQMDQDTDELCFTHTFAQPCTLLGSARAVLYMSTDEHDDMDVHVQVRKADANGTVLQHMNIPKSDREAVGMAEVKPINPMIYLGPTGALRASYRALDHQLSTKHWPEQEFSHSEKL
jgi:predicted acyl esterase